MSLDFKETSTQFRFWLDPASNCFLICLRKAKTAALNPRPRSIQQQLQFGNATTPTYFQPEDRFARTRIEAHSPIAARSWLSLSRVQKTFSREKLVGFDGYTGAETLLSIGRLARLW